MIKEDVDTKVLDDEPIGGAVGDQMNFDEPSSDDPTPDSVTDTPEAAGDNSAQMAEAAKEWQDKYLRLSAEFDNYRKRTLKEKMELVATGCEDVIKAMLTVMDDIDRALAAMETAKDVASVRQGVLLIHQKLMDTLRSRGVEEIEALGKPFDPNFMNAVQQVPPAEGQESGTVVQVFQKGYKIGDKIIRHATVVVAE